MYLRPSFRHGAGVGGWACGTQGGARQKSLLLVDEALVFLSEPVQSAIQLKMAHETPSISRGENEGFQIPPGAKDSGEGGWIRISMVSPGDIISVKTEDNSYAFICTGDGFAAMLAGTGGAREVKLLGCADSSGSNISWGCIQRGGRLLFSDHGEEGLATMTSPIQSIRTRTARPNSSARPMVAHVPSRTPTPVAPKVAAAAAGTPRLAKPTVRV